MKYLGVDYGAKRVGLAVSDDPGTIAFPRTTFENDEKLLSSLLRLIHEEKVTAVVVGDTLSFSGRENPVTKGADEFVQRLRQETELPVERARELWSSIEASRYAPKGEEHNDAAAAAIILQRFLDMRGAK